MPRWNCLLAAISCSQASPSSMSSYHLLRTSELGGGQEGVPGAQCLCPLPGLCTHRVLCGPSLWGFRPHRSGALTQNKLLGTFSCQKHTVSEEDGATRLTAGERGTHCSRSHPQRAQESLEPRLHEGAEGQRPWHGSLVLGGLTMYWQPRAHPLGPRLKSRLSRDRSSP